MLSGGGSLGRLDHEGAALVHGIRALIRVVPESSLVPREDTVSRQWSVNQELGPPDTESGCIFTLDLPASRTVKKHISAVMSHPV